MRPLCQTKQNLLNNYDVTELMNEYYHSCSIKSVTFIFQFHTLTVIIIIEEVYVPMLHLHLNFIH